MSTPTSLPNWTRSNWPLSLPRPCLEAGALAIRRFLAVGAATALLALALVPSVLYPLARDQALFAYAGQVILDGGLPYRDVFEQKGPATHYTFALILALWGQEQWKIRAAFALVVLASAALAAVVARRLAGPRCTWPAAWAVVLALSHGRGAQYFTTQVEDIILLLSLGSLLLLGSAQARTCWWRWPVAALFMGLACCYKPTALVPSVALGTLALGYAWSEAPDEKRFLRWLTWAATSVLGFLFPAVVLVGYLWWQGAWEDFWVSVVEHNRTYAATNRTPWSGALMLLGGGWSRLTLAVALTLLGGLCRPTRFFYLVLALGWGHYLAVVWQGKYWPYHWTPVLGTLAILAAPALVHLSRRITRGLGPWAQKPLWQPALLTALAFLVCATHPVQYLDTWTWIVRLARGKITLEEYYGLFTTGQGDGQEVLQVARFIRQHSAPEDTLLVWGREPMLHFLSRRRAPCRFVLGLSVCRFDSPRILQWRREYLAALKTKKPAFVVLVHGDETYFSPEGMKAQLKYFRALEQWLHKHYRPVHTWGPYELWAPVGKTLLATRESKVP